MTTRRAEVALAAGYSVLLTACVVVSIGWLALGALVALATYVPSIADQVSEQAAAGSAWAAGVLEAVPRSEPLGQAVMDYLFSGLNLLIAAVLLFLGLRTWVTQLLAVAMIGSAGAFNLQAHAAAVAMQTATGLNIGTIHQIVLHGVACAAYVVALLLLPAGHWDIGPRSGMRRWALVAVGIGTLVVVGFGTALLPHTISCILFFGFAVPLAGLAVLPNRIRNGATAVRRTQARLLFSVLLAAFGTCVVLAVLTVLLWYLGEPGLMLVDPTAHTAAIAAAPVQDTPPGQPTALLFWFSRLSAAGIAAAVLVAIRRGGLWQAERMFSRGLASMMVIVLIGGGYVVISAVAGWLPGTDSSTGEVIAAAAATGLAALVFLPAYLRAERLVDRLLYGRRPTPYSVLADVAALSRTTSTEGPNLAGVAEAIGRGLGARSCRLTVLRPGLRDRTYAWSDGSDSEQSGAADDHVVLPIRQGSEQIGSIAVDRGAVAGLHTERRTLLDDVADSLGAILQASRLGIELERQLRAALAHAEEIALSRRQAVAEMDSERRMIERDLHDGAQHHLVSLRLALGLVEYEVGSGKLEQARGRLDQLNTQIDTTEAVLAKTASGVSSIVLSKRGLPTALAADLAGADPPIAMSFDGGVDDRRYPPDIEAAIYFCCLEAVNNARKHAAGAPIAVRIWLSDGALRFSVRDQGPGFDAAASTKSGGRGQRNLQTRISGVSGRIEVISAPGAGTTVQGSVPVPAELSPGATQPVRPELLEALQTAAQPTPPERAPADRTPAEDRTARPLAGQPAAPLVAADTTQWIATQPGQPARPAEPITEPIHAQAPSGWAAAQANAATQVIDQAATEATQKIAPQAPPDAARPTPTQPPAHAPKPTPTPRPTDAPKPPPTPPLPTAAKPGAVPPLPPAAKPGAVPPLPAAAKPSPTPRPTDAPKPSPTPPLPTAAKAGTVDAPTAGSVPPLPTAAKSGAVPPLPAAAKPSPTPRPTDAPKPSPTPRTADAAKPSPTPPLPPAAKPSPAPPTADAPTPGPVPPLPAAAKPSPTPRPAITPKPSPTPRATRAPKPSPAPQPANASASTPTPPLADGTKQDAATTQSSGPAPTGPTRQLKPAVSTTQVVGAQPANGDRSLRGQALGLIRAAQAIYPEGPESVRLAELARQLNEPCQVGVLGVAGSGASTLLRALRLQPFNPPLELLDREAPDQSPVARIAVLRGPGREDAALFEPPPESTAPAPPPTIGVLARADELGGSGADALQRANQVADEYREDPDVSRHCQALVPVAGLLALAGSDLDEAVYRALCELSERSPAEVPEQVGPDLLAKLGRFGVEQAVRLIRGGEAPDPATLGEALVRLSGLARLHELLVWRFARPTQALRVRATLVELETLVRTSTVGGPHIGDLLYQLERTRFGAHELVEIDLADALQSGTLRLPDVDRHAAEQLLGADGAEPRARLGLAEDASPSAIKDAAGERLMHWQLLASHPATTSAVRDAARILVRTCEELLSAPTG
ncbi:MAG TPA: ATP-binding protein [Pseudonocardia sp.]|uniref:sensor histidine kinase n=1 Tax=Pseudonocardia sp. TaxID=60912 RepID=UPI002CC5CF85|nr:ATP-binding protein [Pseudonocardia sp.]HTF51025.1 ATP-binding protein [Pseudonocardia sp.]